VYPWTHPSLIVHRDHPDRPDNWALPDQSDHMVKMDSRAVDPKRAHRDRLVPLATQDRLASMAMTVVLAKPVRMRSTRPIPRVPRVQSASPDQPVMPAPTAYPVTMASRAVLDRRVRPANLAIPEPTVNLAQREKVAHPVTTVPIVHARNDWPRIRLSPTDMDTIENSCNCTLDGINYRI